MILRLSGAWGEQLHGDESTAQGGDRDVVEQRQLGFAPFAFVGFITDGEIEDSKTTLDGLPRQIAKMRRA